LRTREEGKIVKKIKKREEKEESARGRWYAGTGMGVPLKDSEGRIRFLSVWGCWRGRRGPGKS